MAKQTKSGLDAATAALDELKAAEARGVADGAAGPAGTIVLVRGPEDGRRRGGMTFGPIDIEIDLGAIARADMQAILDDPCLSVRPKPADAEA